MSERKAIRVGKPHRPLPIQAINFVGRAAKAIGVQPVSLDREALISRAVAKAGTDDFGGDDFMEGLGRFLASVEEEAELTLLGRMMVQGYVTDNLANRLRLVDWRKRHPEIDDEPILAPLVIVGLPRTGTTILHALLDCDPANRSPLFWEVQFPVPPAAPETWGTDPRIAQHQKILEQLFKLAPGFEAMHPMGATMPQECVAIFTMCFRSAQLGLQFNVPAYQDWVDDAEMRSTYEFHRRFLQHAQSGGVRGDRWLLKSPAHLHLLDTLLDVYPDAKIIHTHRDPLEVCVSAASLTATLRGVATDSLDLHAIGGQQVQLWAKLVNRSVAQRKRLADRRVQFFDMRMTDLVRDPVEMVRQIYSYFGYPLSAAVEDRMIEFMRNNPRNKHGSHAYSAADFDIDPVRDRLFFDDYIDYFGLEK